MPAAPPLEEPLPPGPSHPPFQGLERMCQARLTLRTAGRGSAPGQHRPAGRKWARGSVGDQGGPSSPQAPDRVPPSHTLDGHLPPIRHLTARDSPMRRGRGWAEQTPPPWTGSGQSGPGGLPAAPSSGTKEGKGSSVQTRGPRVDTPQSREQQ